MKKKRVMELLVRHSNLIVCLDVAKELGVGTDKIEKARLRVAKQLKKADVRLLLEADRELYNREHQELITLTKRILL